MSIGESSLGLTYRRIYDWICGNHPNLRPWHFQWLAIFYLHQQLRRILPTMRGKILDVGCGGKPYRCLFGQVIEYVGLDVLQGSQVDVVVASNEPWPFPDLYFDVLLSSQVLEHVEHLGLTLAEMNRVLKPGGTIILSYPFLYHEHGAPWDFQRFTAHRAVKLFQGFEVVNLEREGGIGSTLTILLLAWVEQTMNNNFVTRLLKAPLLPVWLIVSFILNLVGLLVDRIDRTGSFYNNVLIVVRKPFI